MDKTSAFISVREKFVDRIFLKNSKFGESSANNLETLTNVINYFRLLVIPLYESFAQEIRTKSILLEARRKYLLEDMEKLQESTDKTVLNTQSLSEKLDAIKSKQFELLQRTESIIFETRNRQNTISDSEKKYVSGLETIEKLKVRVLQSNIEQIKSNKNLLEVQEEHWNTVSDNYYLNDSQIKIVRDSLYVMGLEIDRAIDRLFSLEEILNSNESE